MTVDDGLIMEALFLSLGVSIDTEARDELFTNLEHLANSLDTNGKKSAAIRLREIEKKLRGMLDGLTKVALKNKDEFGK